MTETGSGVVYDGVPARRRRGPHRRRRPDPAAGADAAAGATATAPTRAIDGWFPTGDLGTWLPDGRLHVRRPRRRPHRHRRREGVARSGRGRPAPPPGRRRRRRRRPARRRVGPGRHGVRRARTPAVRRRSRTCGRWPRSTWRRTARPARWCSSRRSPAPRSASPAATRCEGAADPPRPHGGARQTSAVAGGVGGLAGVLDLDDVAPGVGPAAVEVGEPVDLGQLPARQRLPVPAGAGRGRRRARRRPGRRSAGSRRWRSAATPRWRRASCPR